MVMSDHEDEAVKFNATIEPPHADCPAAPPPSPPTPTTAAEVPCCPVMPHRSSDLVDALPVVLVGIGCAYAIGLATGAWIFSTPE